MQQFSSSHCLPVNLLLHGRYDEVTVCGSHDAPPSAVQLDCDYRTWENFGGGNFWQTVQVYVKAIGEKKFGDYTTVSAYAKYIFGVSVRKFL